MAWRAPGVRVRVEEPPGDAGSGAVHGAELASKRRTSKSSSRVALPMASTFERNELCAPVSTHQWGLPSAFSWSASSSLRSTALRAFAAPLITSCIPERRKRVTRSSRATPGGST